MSKSPAPLAGGRMEHNMNIGGHGFKLKTQVYTNVSHFCLVSL